jgi:hypothetical protein
LSHGLYQPPVAKERPDDLGHIGTVQLAVQQHVRSPGGNQRLRIPLLMIIGSEGKRHEDRRLPERAELRHGAGTRPTEAEIGGGVDQGHFPKEGLHHRSMA